MNSRQVTTLLAAASILAALPTTGCAKENAAPAPASVADRTAASPTAQPTPSAPVSRQAPVRWEDIADCSYAQRARFLAGMKALELQVDAQIEALTTRRVIMQRNNTDTSDWDFSMKEMQDARSYLKSTDDEARTAPREFWNQTKDKAQRAWVRTQDAYKAVRASTTN